METQRVRIEVKDKGAVKTRRYVFVLLDNFTMLCFASAVESLRIANRMAGKELYTWVLAGEGGEMARCSGGTEFKLQMDLAELNREDIVMVCGGLYGLAPAWNAGPDLSETEQNND